MPYTMWTDPQWRVALVRWSQPTPTADRIDLAEQAHDRYASPDVDERDQLWALLELIVHSALAAAVPQHSSRARDRLDDACELLLVGLSEAEYVPAVRQALGAAVTALPAMARGLLRITHGTFGDTVTREEREARAVIRRAGKTSRVLKEHLQDPVWTGEKKRGDRKADKGEEAKKGKGGLPEPQPYAELSVRADLSRGPYGRYRDAPGPRNRAQSRP